MDTNLLSTTHFPHWLPKRQLELVYNTWLWTGADLLSSSCFPPQVYSLNWSYKKKGLKTTQEQEIWKGSCTGLMLPTVRSLGLGWTSVQQSWVYVTQGWLSCPSRPIFLILEGPIPSLSLVDNRKWGDLLVKPFLLFTWSWAFCLRVSVVSQHKFPSIKPSCQNCPNWNWC